MAKYTRLIVSFLIVSISLHACCALDVADDPTLEVIREQDAEESDVITNPESLQCNNPHAKTNKVTLLSGDPWHMSSEAHVECLPGLRFMNGKTSVNVSCTPAPHPCMCIALWQTLSDFSLLNDLNCTAHVVTPPTPDERYNVDQDRNDGNINIKTLGNKGSLDTENESKQNVKESPISRRETETNELSSEAVEIQKQTYSLNRAEQVEILPIEQPNVEIIDQKADGYELYDGEEVEEREAEEDEEEEMRLAANEVQTNPVKEEEVVEENEPYEEEEIQTEQEQHFEEEENNETEYEEPENEETVNEVLQNEETEDENEREQTEQEQPVQEDSEEEEIEEEEIENENVEEEKIEHEETEEEEIEHEETEEEEIEHEEKERESAQEETEEEEIEKEETWKDEIEESEQEEIEKEEVEQKEPEQEIEQEEQEQEYDENTITNLYNPEEQNGYIDADEDLDEWKETQLIQEELNDAEEYEEYTNSIDLNYLTRNKIKEPSLIMNAIKDTINTNTEDDGMDIPEASVDTKTRVDPPGWFEDVQLEPVEGDEESYEINTDELAASEQCSLLPETGPCRMYLPRYYYNTKTNECDLFIYGGCSGNANNFSSLKKCIDTCASNTHL